MDWKLELVSVPVTDVDRAKDFYRARRTLDYDRGERQPSFRAADAYWVCVLDRVRRRSDRPGSGSAQCQLVVSDIDEARGALSERGVEVSEVQEFDWGKFLFFSDPDGNRWAVQQLPPR